MSQSSLVPADAARAVQLAGSVQVETAGIVSRTLLQTPELRVVLFAFAAGQELTTHTNRRRALLQVLSGEGEFFFDGRWHTLASGAWVHLPPGHPHAVRAGDLPFTLLLTLASEPAPSVSEP
jgi:quercetin dioxygenase-like cupin family protein